MSALQPDDSYEDDSKPRDDAENPSAWLVGPDEGLAAELERTGSKAEEFKRPTLLRRSGAEDVPLTPPPPSAIPHVGRVVPDTGGDEIERGPGAMAWSPGHDSVPSLRNNDGERYVPQPTRDFPMDDAEERSSGMAEYADLNEPPPHEVVNPEAFELAAAPSPWWKQLIQTLGSDRRIQVILGLVLVVLVAVAMWPRGEKPMSVGRLRKQAATMDGAQVLVSGRVGEVFPVGGGYAYYLRDGKDTLVVFTRVTHPVSRRPITVRGTMSIGYLDGVATPALFESNEPR